MGDENLYWVWLTNLNGIGHVTQDKLIQVFGSPQKIWEANEDDLKHVEFLDRKEKIPTILSKKNREVAYISLKTIDKLGIDIISIDDKRYPEPLKNIYQYPKVIFVKGQLKNDDFHFAIVGTRKATDYGRRVTKQISEDLARSGITIVSGMAEGIDTQAHKGALNVGGRTIAVLGSGHSRIFPQSNEKLSWLIADNGAVITEYLPNVTATKYTFPERNRIISGLSRGVLVVESGKSSGALITAERAQEQNRDLFVVPGNITSSKSEGSNNLLKEGAAAPVTEALDIIQTYENKGEKKFLEYEKRKNIFETKAYKNCSDTQKNIINLLFVKSMDMDEIVDITGFSISGLSYELIMLEINGLIRGLPGGLYCIN
jgi:DNA processing protein